jgi:uncharacterized RDD family membrane protein YckC
VSPSQAPWNEKLTIETPEQTVFDFPLAGVGSRGLALALDTLLEIAGSLLLVIAAGYLSSALKLVFPSGKAGVWLGALLILAFFCLYYGYFALFEALWNGQTPGKRWMHLRVIHDSGRPISISQAIARNLVRFVDQLPSFYAVGLICALISRQNRRLGDYVAGTVVVHERPLEKGSAAWAEPSPTAIPVTSLRWGAAQLSAEDARLLSGFLARRSTLDGLTRNRLAKEIAQRLTARLAITAQQRHEAGLLGDEGLLEALDRERQG